MGLNEMRISLLSMGKSLVLISASLLFVGCGSDSGRQGQDGAFGMAVSDSDLQGEVASPTNNYVSKQIGPAGGTLDGPNGVVVVFPPNAVATTTKFTVGTLDTTAELAPPLGTRYSGNVYSFEPHGFVFATPVRISMPGAALGNVFHAACLSTTAHGTSTGCMWDPTPVMSNSFPTFPATGFSLYTLTTPLGDAGDGSGGEGADAVAGGSEAGSGPYAADVSENIVDAQLASESGPDIPLGGGGSTGSGGGTGTGGVTGAGGNSSTGGVVGGGVIDGGSHAADASEDIADAQLASEAGPDVPLGEGIIDAGNGGPTGSGNKIGLIGISELSQSKPDGGITKSVASVMFGFQPPTTVGVTWGEPTWVSETFGFQPANVTQCDVTTEGDCQLFVCPMPSSIPANGPPPPPSYQAGTVTMTGLAVDIPPLGLNPQGEYQSSTYSDYLWSSSRLATVTVTASADVPAFTMSLTAPSPISVTSPIFAGATASYYYYVISRSSDLVVTWSGGVDGTAQLVLQDSVPSTATSTHKITCNVDAATGTVTVPASLMPGFYSNALGVFYIRLFSSATQNIGDWLMEFEADVSIGWGSVSFTK